ncbi:MAG: aminotransferase class IV, partial [Pseudomonadales bacterium]|nr:aminotransferase class IV [Pseudomonadales bacterium]
AVRLAPPLSDEAGHRLISTGIDKCAATFATVYLQVTRGVAPQRQHEYYESPPTVFLMVSEAPKLARQEITPLSVITLEDFRWARGDIKSISLVASGLLRNEAIAQGANDAILIRDGFVTEATASNVFVVKDGTIATPPRSEFLLHGITRDHVIQAAREGGLTVEERPISRQELDAADEIFVTSTGQEAWPVGRLNGSVVGNGEGGVIWKQVDDLFQAMKARLIQE